MKLALVPRRGFSPKPMAILAAFALAGASCSGIGASSADQANAISISGSSTVEPISFLAADFYFDEDPDVVITVDGPGTGDGFQRFCAGETDISGASRPIKESEAADCEASGVSYTELEIAFDGIALMTNPANPVECVSFNDLYALLGPESNEFDSWADAQSLADELGTSNSFPDADIDISGPGTESGTYDSFIEIVLEHTVEERLGEDAESFIRDFPGNADDNVIVQGIIGSDSSLGWSGFAFAEENRDSVKILEVDNGESGCIAPTVETIADGSYPVSRSLFIYVSNDRADANPALDDFVDYYLNEAYSEAVTTAFGASGYVELPPDQLAGTRDAWTNR